MREARATENKSEERLLREAARSYLAPAHRYPAEFGEALLLQLVGAAPIRYTGTNRVLRRDIHVLLVTKRSREEATSIMNRVTAVDPARSELVSYGDEDEDWITRSIRRSEGWRFTRKGKEVTSREPLMVEGGVTVTAIFDRSYRHLHTDDDEERGILYAMLRGDEQYVRFQRTKTRIAIPTRCAVLGIGREELNDKRGSLGKALLRSHRNQGLLREFDVVLPLDSLESKRARGQDAWALYVLPDESVSLTEDVDVGGPPVESVNVMSWVAKRRAQPAPSVPSAVRKALSDGLEGMTERWQSHGSRTARAVLGLRAECTLLRLAVASARSWGRTSTTSADAKTALHLMEYSWRTISSFNVED